MISDDFRFSCNIRCYGSCDVIIYVIRRWVARDAGVLTVSAVVFAPARVLALIYASLVSRALHVVQKNWDVIVQGIEPVTVQCSPATALNLIKEIACVCCSVNAPLFHNIC